jgi:DNA-binding IclR family transcriptional regulator
MKLQSGGSMEVGTLQETGEPTGRDAPEESNGGVQAIETGMRVLAALLELGPTPMLKTIAERAGMPPPKAHRYLTSYCRSGLVERHPTTGGYRLGPLAVRLGLAALRHLDVVSETNPALDELRDELGFSTGLGVWGTAGPTFVRVAETDSVVILSIRPGSVMPILNSAVGRIFGAYMPRSRTGALIEAELHGQTPTAAASAFTGRSPTSISPEEMESIFSQVRRAGVANVVGDLNLGIHALAAPIFDHEKEVVGALSVFGGAGLIDVDPAGRNARVLKAKAMEISRRLGMA